MFFSVFFDRTRKVSSRKDQDGKNEDILDKKVRI